MSNFLQKYVKMLIIIKNIKTLKYKKKKIPTTKYSSSSILQQALTQICKKKKIKIKKFCKKIRAEKKNSTRKNLSKGLLKLLLLLDNITYTIERIIGTNNIMTIFVVIMFVYKFKHIASIIIQRLYKYLRVQDLNKYWEGVC